MVIPIVIFLINAMLITKGILNKILNKIISIIISINTNNKLRRHFSLRIKLR
jgi:hypothetical protein